MKRMLDDFYLHRVSEHYSLREMLAKLPEPEGRDLPIKGGWGYSLSGPIIIDKYDPSVEDPTSFKGIPLEYEIIRKRLYLELVVAQMAAGNEGYQEVQYQPVEQRLLSLKTGQADYIRIEGTCFEYEDWLQILEHFEKVKDDPEMEEHIRLRERLQLHFTSEYYFDITSFFGSY